MEEMSHWTPEGVFVIIKDIGPRAGFALYFRKSGFPVWDQELRAACTTLEATQAALRLMML